MRESNKKIENAIREIREAQAEKERTRIVREELNEFKQQVLEIDTKEKDEMIERKMRQILERRERKEKRKAEKQQKQQTAAVPKVEAPVEVRGILEGDAVRIKGIQTVGKVESISGKNATVIFGDVRTKMKLEQLELSDKEQLKSGKTVTAADKYAHLAVQTSRMTSATIEDRKQNFHQDIDVRGMRGDEAVNAVMHFIDDAILVGMSRVRVLHGTGTGVLRQLVRQYLATVPNVSHFRDEHVQFGGAGITVVDID